MLTTACGLHRVERCGEIALGQKASSLQLGTSDEPWRCSPRATRTPPPSGDEVHFPTTVSVADGPLNDFECCCDQSAGAKHGCNVDCSSSAFAEVRPRKVTSLDFSQATAGDRGNDTRDLGWCFVWVRGDEIVGRYFFAN